MSVINIGCSSPGLWIIAFPPTIHTIQSRLFVFSATNSQLIADKNVSAVYTGGNCCTCAVCRFIPTTFIMAVYSFPPLYHQLPDHCTLASASSDVLVAFSAAPPTPSRVDDDIVDNRKSNATRFARCLHLFISAWQQLHCKLSE